MNRYRLILLLLTPLAILIVHDWLQPRDREVTTRVAVAAIEEYREHVSPRLTGRVFCRFEPTCSAYGLESVKRHGALVGGVRAGWRVLRCGPWTPSGTVDPP